MSRLRRTPNWRFPMARLVRQELVKDASMLLSVLVALTLAVLA